MVKPHEFTSRGKPQLTQFQKGVDVLQHSDVYIAGERYGDENLCISLLPFGAAESPSLGIDTLILDVNKLLDYSMLRRSNLSLVGVLLTKT